MSWRSAFAWLAFVVSLFLIGWVSVFLVPERAGKAGYKYLEVENLPGWGGDSLNHVLSAFLATCPRFSGLPEESIIGDGAAARKAEDWQYVCEKASALSNSGNIRQFIETSFDAYRRTSGWQDQGLLTGYYEPELSGSLTPSTRYSIPLYRRPPELITVNLGDFRDDLKGRRIAGRVDGGRLSPFSGRAEIEQGALAGRGLELVWVDNAVDAFFLHIQGSGRIRLENGDIIRVGYDGPNGHPYTSLGRLMRDRGILHPDNISLVSIKSWLEDNPVVGRDLMQENASYIFFRRLDGDIGEEEGPLGAAGISLTPRRSMAVDRTEWPLGALLWVDATYPDPNNPGKGKPLPLRHLFVAQDTGGAIRGPLRGDIFWGAGGEAENIAGHMANFSKFYILVPRKLDSGHEEP